MEYFKLKNIIFFITIGSIYLCSAKLTDEEKSKIANDVTLYARLVYGLILTLEEFNQDDPKIDAISLKERDEVYAKFYKDKNKNLLGTISHIRTELRSKYNNGDESQELFDKLYANYEEFLKIALRDY